MESKIYFEPWTKSSTDSTIVQTIVIGDKSRLSHLATLLPALALTEPLMKPLVEKHTDNLQLWRGKDSNATLTTIVSLGDERTRHTGSIRSDLIPDLISKHLIKKGNVQVIVVCADGAQAVAVSAAIARAFPLYCRKTGEGAEGARVVYADVVSQVQNNAINHAHLQRIGNAVRKCAKLVDMPTNELNTTTYVEEVKRVVDSLPGVSLKLIEGAELERQGFGGIWGVGKASEHLPALAILSHLPAGSKKTTVWVGKGIVYDTGGLSMKDKNSMPTMKSDMGGSAAILSAFEAIVLSGYKNALHAVLCLAENSVDAKSTRPDDILTMYSGKTVEINNTDAEGRLVLADGVSYATKHLRPDVLIDMATLTGAQGIATGEKHAAILCNDSNFESEAYKVGQVCGDWVFPILYAPELLKKEFHSNVADMKNSVKSRSNAQSSCAGHFIEDHLDASYKGIWMHVDIAYPSFRDARGTGFGTTLLVELLGRSSS